MAKIMYLPVIQGMLRYAYKVSELQGVLRRTRSTYANHQISHNDVVDIATQVAMKSGLFNEASKEWQRRDPTDKTWTDWQ